MKTLINAYLYDQNKIKHIFLEEGIPKSELIQFKPILGVLTNKKNTEWTDINNRNIDIKHFNSISEMMNWKKENKQFQDILGDVPPHIQFIAKEYPEDIPFSTKGLCIINFDIETIRDRKDTSIENKKGFPRPREALFPIVSITFQDMLKNEFFIFAYHDNYKVKEKNTTFIKCENEQDLLERVVKFFKEKTIHILTGFNIESFDIPYLVNRISKKLSFKIAKQLSPDNVLKSINFINDFGEEDKTYLFQGIIVWDFQKLYKKFVGEPREQWNLNYISNYELGEGKVSFSEDHENLEDLFYKNFELFIDYNKKDVELIYELNNKFRFIELAFSLLHLAKCSPESIFATVQPWDCILYNELLKNKKLCPASNINSKTEYPGGFVLEPSPGLHKWIKVFDIVSSYPNNIISSNMSPDTIINYNELPEELKNIKQRFGSIENCIDVTQLKEVGETCKKYDVTFTSNGQFFRTDFVGFIPNVVNKIFNLRLQAKSDIKKAKKENNKQLQEQKTLLSYTYKILLNSLYGSLANIYSRYYDIRIAEAITSDGQVCVRGAELYIQKTLGIYTKYIDTDSIFLDLEPFLIKRFGSVPIDKKICLDFILKLSEKVIQPKINEFFNLLSTNLNMPTTSLGMEPECVASSAVFVAKKRYIMNKVWDEGDVLLDKPKQKVRGVEIVRTSSPLWCRSNLKKAVQLIFESDNEDELIKFVEKLKKEFFTLSFEQVSFPRGVQIGNYNLNSVGLPIHTRAALLYNKQITDLKLTNRYPLIHNGDKIKFCYIKVPNKMQSNVFGVIKNLPIEIKGIDIDYEQQFKKAFLDPLSGITEKIGWKLEKTATIEDFFC